MSSQNAELEPINPFTPTFGEVPPVFAGRQVLLTFNG